MVYADILNFHDMRNIIIICFILVLTACTGNQKNKNGSSGNQVQSPENNSITVYEGTLPCADCKGIQTTLTLFQNKLKNQCSYKLHEVYLGQNSDKTFDTYGKWVALKGTQEDPTAIVYQLSVQNEDPEDSDVINYLVVDKNTIKMIDSDMNVYESKENYTLTRKTD
jgi:copper homeostasis protein (lipoprotein)